MSTIFNYCDSVSRYSSNLNDDHAVIDTISHATTPEEFEQTCIEHPQFHLNHCNKFLQTALHRAAEENNVALIKHIVERAPQLLERGNERGSTALVFAAISDKSEAVETLLGLGANPNITTDTRILNIIIHYLSECSDTSQPSLSRIAKLLIMNGAELSESYQKETQLKVNLIFEKLSKEIAKEIVTTLNDCTPLINDLSKLISQY